MSSNMRVSARNIRHRRYRHPLSPQLANQKANVPMKQAYLNLELTSLSLSLCGKDMGLLLSLPSVPLLS